MSGQPTQDNCENGEDKCESVYVESINYTHETLIEDIIWNANVIHSIFMQQIDLDNSTTYDSTTTTPCILIPCFGS